MKKTIVASIIALTMGMGGVGAAAQFDAIGDAAKKVGHATKETGEAVVHGTKKAVGTTGHEMKKAVTPRAKCAWMPPWLRMRPTSRERCLCSRSCLTRCTSAMCLPRAAPR